jgi:hypothetical protein
MAKDQPTPAKGDQPETEVTERVPLSDADRAKYTAILAAGPKNGEKFSDAEIQARKEAKSAILADEDNKAKFKRLSTARLNAALDVIALIGNLSGPNYEYTQAQVDFIRARLHIDVDKAMDRFKPKVPTAERETVEIPD